MVLRARSARARPNGSTTTLGASIHRTGETMDINTPAIKFCIESTRAEYDGRLEDARALCLQALQVVRDDYEACVVAHYMARYQERPQDTLYWNQEALSRADAVGDESVQPFYPSLYINIGSAYERLGNLAEASRYYKLAEERGLSHQVESREVGGQGKKPK